MQNLRETFSLTLLNFSRLKICHLGPKCQYNTSIRDARAAWSMNGGIDLKSMSKETACAWSLVYDQLPVREHFVWFMHISVRWAAFIFRVVFSIKLGPRHPLPPPFPLSLSSSCFSIHKVKLSPLVDADFCRWRCVNFWVQWGSWSCSRRMTFKFTTNNPGAAYAKTRMGMIERFNGTIWGYTGMLD